LDKTSVSCAANLIVPRNLVNPSSLKNKPLEIAWPKLWRRCERLSRRRPFRTRREITNLTITVHGNDIERAMRDLKRTLQREGLFKELKKRRFYDKPSVKKKRKQMEAERRRRKALRYKRRDRD
jgi:small subunit ribosomal protein S21